MPVYRLAKPLVFPSPSLAEPDGLLAVGGDLSPQRLLLAYRQGIFPWYSENTPILWWSPDPRLVLIPGELTVSRSLVRVLRKSLFRVSFDRAFRRVVESCAVVPRRYGDGTWIVPEMMDAYEELHRMGYAHSVETWQNGVLVGGLYGVALGRAFFGESMFALRPDASKVALVHLVRLLIRWGFDLIDCQVVTEHLRRLGAREVPRQQFLSQLEAAVAKKSVRGSWASVVLG
ncbi:MAG TPA: leucyl/phenylalanyl-tRNA--protein transferase [Syntrophobacteraceae bacterium]|nr:leucyl/phenylalanyl-tRNA--protein transferase [Syntrophobacteraceae bacterium]